MAPRKTLPRKTASVTRTALNRVENYHVVNYQEQTIDRSDIPAAIEALRDYKQMLEGLTTTATIYDPNNNNIQLDWAKTALSELDAEKQDKTASITSR